MASANAGDKFRRVRPRRTVTRPRSIDWSSIEGPVAFGTVGALGYGIWDSIAFGHLDWFAGTTGAQEYAQQHSAYYVGLGIGVAGQIALGNYAAGVLLAGANATRLGYAGARAYQAYSLAGDVVGVYDSYQAVRSGNFGAMDLLGFAPTIGWAGQGMAGVRSLGDMGWGRWQFPIQVQRAGSSGFNAPSLFGGLQDLYENTRVSYVGWSKRYGEGYDRIFGSAPTKVTTPNAAARAKSQGEYIDPLTNKVVKTTQKLAADHIFPKARIRELPGFNRLTPAQQSEVLNNLENFRGLPQSLNASKGSRIDWSKYRGQPLDPQYAKELADLQQVMRAEVQAQIEALLGGAK